LKTNFILSNCRELWIDEIKDKFILEKYVHNILTEEGLSDSIGKTIVADKILPSRASALEDHKFFVNKYNLYVEIIARRLNHLHKRNYNLSFWKKAFSLQLYRMIVIAYDSFASFERFYSINKQAVNILSPLSYYTPSDFAENNKYLAGCCNGYEQLFSIYIKCFYNEKCYYNEIDLKFEDAKSYKKKYNVNKINIGKYLNFSQYLIKALQLRNPTVGLYGVYFAKDYLDELIIRSFGNIGNVDFE